jgi:hypothetical protein
MHQAVDRCERHGYFRKHLIPTGERLVGRNCQALAFIAGCDQFEQHRRFGLIAPDVAQVVQDQQVEAIQPGNFGWQAHFSARHLQALYEVAGAREVNTVAAVDQAVADRAHQLAFADAGRSEQKQVGTLLDPAVACDRRSKGACDSVGTVVKSKLDSSLPDNS